LTELTTVISADWRRWTKVT